MRLGLRAYFKQKFRKCSGYASIGIAIDEDAVFFCLLKKDSAENLVLQEEKVVSTNNWPQALMKWVNEEHLHCTPVYVAFSIAFYQQFQLDKPSVNPNEMVSALKWSVNELIGTEENRSIDYFDLPVAIAGSEKVNVVAIEDSKINKVVESVISAGLTLKGISVEEVVTCNLVSAEQDAVLTLIQEGNGEVCANIVKDGNLYFSRRLKGFENLSSFSVDELQMGLIDSLSVQIQRSMDYFESQLRQPPVRQIKFKLDTQHISELQAKIAQAIPAQISILKTNISIPKDTNELRLSYTAIGAALGVLMAKDRVDET